MIRPMTSNGSALSSIVANSHQAIHFVSSAPSIHSVRRVFPQVRMEVSLVLLRPSETFRGFV